MNNDYCATNDKILNKWKLTGLLQNLSEEVNEESGLSEQMECAVLLENTATALSGMASEDNVFNKKMLNYAFPLIRILYGNGLRFCHRNFLTKFDNWLKENPTITKNEEIINKFIIYFKK